MARRPQRGGSMDRGGQRASARPASPGTPRNGGIWPPHRRRHPDRACRPPRWSETRHGHPTGRTRSCLPIGRAWPTPGGSAGRPNPQPAAAGGYGEGDCAKAQKGDDGVAADQRRQVPADRPQVPKPGSRHGQPAHHQQASHHERGGVPITAPITHVTHPTAVTPTEPASGIRSSARRGWRRIGTSRYPASDIPNRSAMAMGAASTGVLVGAERWHGLYCIPPPARPLRIANFEFKIADCRLQIPPTHPANHPAES